MRTLNNGVVVMGIDPSLSSTGYAFLEFGQARFKPIDYGLVKTNPKHSLPERLSQIYQAISELILKHNPDEIAIEEVFYANNAKVALMMGHARGASLVAAANQKKPVAEYAPREIKMAVTGNGNASKEQVKRMVLSLLPLNDATIGYDISDAFSVAICHCHRRTQ